MTIHIGDLTVGQIVRFGSDYTCYLVVEVPSSSKVLWMTLLGTFVDRDSGEWVDFINEPIVSHAATGAPSGWLFTYKVTPEEVAFYNGHLVAQLRRNWQRIQEMYPQVGVCPFAEAD